MLPQARGEKTRDTPNTHKLDSRDSSSLCDSCARNSQHRGKPGRRAWSHAERERSLSAELLQTAASRGRGGYSSYASIQLRAIRQRGSASQVSYPRENPATAARAAGGGRRVAASARKATPARRSYPQREDRSRRRLQVCEADVTSTSPAPRGVSCRKMWEYNSQEFPAQ